LLIDIILCDVIRKKEILHTLAQALFLTIFNLDRIVHVDDLKDAFLFSSYEVVNLHIEILGSKFLEVLVERHYCSFFSVPMQPLIVF